MSGEVKIFPSITKLCDYLGIPSSQKIFSDAVWIQIDDELSEISGLKKTKNHPWIFFESDEFDAENSTFSRTTTRPGGTLRPPKTLGVPSHSSRRCGGSCNFIDKDAWVDFEACAPSGRFVTILQELGMSQAVETFKGIKGAKSCDKEELDIQTQLWTAFRKYRGVI